MLVRSFWRARLRAAAAFVFLSTSFLVPAAPAQCPGWSAALPGLSGLENPRDAVVFDDGQGGGPTLWLAYCGNSWQNPSYGGVKRWNGSAWIEDFTADTVGITSLAVFDDGAGPQLFGGGRFGVWRRDASGWTQIGPSSLRTYTLEVLDLGSGPELFAAGSDAASTSGVCIVRRSQGAWIPLGANIAAWETQIFDLAVFNSGSGPRLIAAGQTRDNITGALAGIVQLTPTGWTSIGGPSTPHAAVSYSVLVPAGQPGVLYAPFTFQGGGRIARWDGSSWSELPGEFEQLGEESLIHKLVEFADDASGVPHLFASGYFDTVGGAPIVQLARFDGQAWTALGSGVDEASPPLWMLVPLSESEGGPRLLVGGRFQHAGGLDTYHLASWIGCGGLVGTVECAGDGSASACPCGSGGPGRGCPNSVEPLGARLQAHGTSGLTSDTLHLQGSSMPNGAALYFQGTALVGGGNGALFGDGLVCASGSIVRLALVTNSHGHSKFPSDGDPTLSARGMVTAPGIRSYQVWYRNAAAFCTSAAFNLTNGIAVSWSP